MTLNPSRPKRSSIESVLEGVVLRPLDLLPDNRGSFVETYRQEWFPESPPLKQYQFLTSGPGVLRGFHVHAMHHDYLCASSGAFLLGLRDMRPWSSTAGQAVSLVLDASEPAVIHIPPGVGHGFFFNQPCNCLLGVSHYYDPEDELACRWDDPELGVDWREAVDPKLSERDRTAGSYVEMQEQLLSLIQ
jgi:dTDP-4-dehydrorhamnose 3,5-epimerase